MIGFGKGSTGIFSHEYEAIGYVYTYYWTKYSLTARYIENLNA